MQAHQKELQRHAVGEDVGQPQYALHSGSRTLEGYRWRSQACRTDASAQSQGGLGGRVDGGAVEEGTLPAFLCARTPGEVLDSPSDTPGRDIIPQAACGTTQRTGDEAQQYSERAAQHRKLETKGGRASCVNCHSAGPDVVCAHRDAIRTRPDAVLAVSASTGARLQKTTRCTVPELGVDGRVSRALGANVREWRRHKAGGFGCR